jgi:hypothetical protein
MKRILACIKELKESLYLLLLDAIKGISAALLWGTAALIIWLIIRLIFMKVVTSGLM